MPSNKKLLQAAAGSAGESLYVEDVFSTYVYTGNSSNPITINNGIDFAGKGGLFWNRDRNTGYTGSVLLDTERGTLQTLATDQTSANVSISSNKNVTYNSNGISIQAASSTATGVLNFSGYNLCSWSFRKQKGFFDCVKFSTTGGGGQQTVSHNLGSIPGTIILKQLTAGADGYWYVINKNVTSPNSDWWLNYANLNITAAFGYWGSTAGIYSAPTSSAITVSTYFTNQTADFIAYFFAEGGSDDQIFGDDGDENIIKCGSYTTDGAGKASVNLGWEPQFILTKSSSGTGGWYMFDTMRGLTGNFGAAASAQKLFANDLAAESAQNAFSISATGFNDEGGIAASQDFIYIAIRRGPMKTPTAGTEVFASQNPGYPLNSAGEAFTSGFPVDWALSKEVSATDDWLAMSRLQGAGNFLETNTTAAEASGVTYGTFDHMTGWYSTASANMSWMFKRAAGFMDVVCFTGDSGNTNQRVLHNLTVAPELIIYKGRNKVNYWRVYAGRIDQYTVLNLTNAATTWPGFWGTSAPTTTDFGFNPNLMDLDAFNAVAYLFATVAGVSKVGSYTGTGAGLNVDCGFTGGARFILIKRTDATGDWYVYDSLRGITAGNDPYLLLNTTAAQVTGTNYVESLNAGFKVTSSASSTVNVNGGTYIFLAIAQDYQL